MLQLLTRVLVAGLLDTVGFAQKPCQLCNAGRKLALSLSSDSCHLFVDIAVIVESTYGVSKHLPRDQREQRFVEKVRGILTRGGRVLLPVVALGRAQVIKLETCKANSSSYHTSFEAFPRQALKPHTLNHTSDLSSEHKLTTPYKAASECMKHVVMLSIHVYTKAWRVCCRKSF